MLVDLTLRDTTVIKQSLIGSNTTENHSHIMILNSQLISLPSTGGSTCSKNNRPTSMMLRSNTGRDPQKWCPAKSQAFGERKVFCQPVQSKVNLVIAGSSLLHQQLPRTQKESIRSSLTQIMMIQESSSSHSTIWVSQSKL